MLTELLGRGAMGRVFAARVAGVEGDEVAVKLLRDDLTGDPGLVARFLQEGRVLKSVRHPNVVGIRDLVVEGEDLGIVMDLVRSGDLRQAVPTPCPVATAQRIAAEIADGLTAVHAAGITHRDLKPENVLMAEDPDGTLRPRITDFGVSSFADASVSRSTGLMGTPGYLAPEVAQGRRADTAADVYALGVILYELCAGRAPFVAEHAMALIRAHADDAVQRPAGLPDPVWAVLERLLAKDPVQRPTAEQTAQLLRGAVGAAGDPAGETLLPAPALNGGHGGHGGHGENAGHGVAPAPEDAATVYRIGTVPPPPAPGRDHTRWRPRRPRVVVAAAAATAAVLVAAAGYLAVTLANGGDRDELALTTTTPAPGATSSPSPASAASAGSPATSASAPAASTSAVAGSPAGASAAPSPGSAPAAQAPAAQAPAPRVTVVAQQKAAPPAAGPATVVVTTQPAPQPVRASSLASVALRDGARLYFGRLDRVLGAGAGVRFRVDPSYRAGHPSQCAVTVVVRGVSGSTGAVFASGLGTGWAAAESAPDQSVAADGGVLHQQVVVPPGSTSVGQSWTLQSSMTVDSANTYLGSARLRVTGEDDEGLLWTVGGTTVRCASG